MLGIRSGTQTHHGGGEKHSCSQYIKLFQWTKNTGIEDDTWSMCNINTVVAKLTLGSSDN